MKLIDDHRCFGCGLENPDGLRVVWETKGHVMTGTFVPSEKYQGWKDVVHGGILATLLDEAMTRLAGILFGGVVTAEMTVRYVKPAKIGEPLFVRGEIVKETSRLIEARSFIHTPDATGILIAHASGKVMRT